MDIRFDQVLPDRNKERMGINVKRPVFDEDRTPYVYLRYCNRLQRWCLQIAAVKGSYSEGKGPLTAGVQGLERGKSDEIRSAMTLV